jgi:hypothetical protein
MFVVKRLFRTTFLGQSDCEHPVNNFASVLLMLRFANNRGGMLRLLPRLLLGGVLSPQFRLMRMLRCSRPANLLRASQTLHSAPLGYVFNEAWHDICFTIGKAKGGVKNVRGTTNAMAIFAHGSTNRARHETCYAIVTGEEGIL